MTWLPGAARPDEARWASNPTARPRRDTPGGQAPKDTAPRKQTAALVLGIAALASVLPLLLWDVRPQWFPPQAHVVLGALPLALIAIVYLFHQILRRAARRDVGKAMLVASAFLFWAANQL